MSGGFNPINMVSQLALATVTGGTSLLVQQVVRQVAMSIIEQALQQIGDNLGLPQWATDMAQADFFSQIGEVGAALSNWQDAIDGFADQIGANAFERATMHAQAQALSDMILNMAKEAHDEEADGESRSSRRGASESSGGLSFIRQLAEALGNRLNEASDELQAKADATDWKDGKDVAEYNAMAQEFGFFMQTVNTAIKVVGESFAAMARKQ